MAPTGRTKMLSEKATIEIRKQVYARPDKTPQEIVGHLAGLGLEVTASAVSACRSNFLAVVAVLRELGAFTQPAPEAPVKAKVKKTPSRADRWSDACTRALDGLEDMRGLQEEYEEWRDSLPENLQSSAVGEKLEAVCGLDIQGAIDTVGEAEGLDLPLGFGRD
jgi:hypothetical protein